jgi:hypothetical protein
MTSGNLADLFGDEHPADRLLDEKTILQLVRLRRLDLPSFRSQLAAARAAAMRNGAADAERKRASEDQAARRTLEATAPGLSAEDHEAIRRVMVEKRVDAFAAAAIVGAQRLAATAS